ncbi:methylosome protein WDR77 [Parasteatoda tepidariorum]|uniref:methylosome protein WDR77 n=1 Tax=Parasteatoda tepidariorum TaxID=114398 RepID=UPI00077FDE6C|nr:methylosome protein 50 [Parasteatoda tepidariorum]
MSSSIPAMVENHLDAIDFTTDGKLIFGSSNLTGRYWNGSLWCFKTIDDAPDVEKCSTGIEVSSGICDLVCLDDKRVVLGLDSGCLEVYKLEDEPEEFKWTLGALEHDDSITSLSLNSNKSSLVSVGADKCGKVWDLVTMATTSTYRPIHGGIVWQVSCSTTDPNIFVTCGQDSKIVLFDIRLPKPATLIDTYPFKCSTTAVCWKPLSDNLFAVGDESGVIAIKDLRLSGSCLSSWDAHKRRIFKMSFSKSKLYLASCADDTDVCVTNVEGDNPLVLCKSDVHDDFVRGLAWSLENDLVSCGWDKKVLKHDIAQ